MNLDRLARHQYGVITRAQALQQLTPAAVRWRLDRGRWRVVYPGVYRVHTGELDWLGRASAALLTCGDGATLALASAAYILGMDTRPPQVLQVDVPNATRRHRPAGVRIRRRRVIRSVRRRGLIVTTVAATVLDLGDVPSASREDAIAVAARSVQQRRVTVEALAAELGARRTHRHRRALELSLGIVAEGAESVLEVDFVRRVLRGHGLPPMRMAVPDHAAGRSIRRDFVDDDHSVIVELDGLLAHEGRRGQDIRRDRSTAARGGVTLRADWGDVHADACRLAVDIFGTKRSRGYRGVIQPCGPGCIVWRLRRHPA